MSPFSNSFIERKDSFYFERVWHSKDFFSVVEKPPFKTTPNAKLF